MIHAAAVLHVHQPKVSQSIGDCRVCGADLGSEPRLLSSTAGQEWICGGCTAEIMASLQRWGQARERRWIGGRL